MSEPYLRVPKKLVFALVPLALGILALEGGLRVAELRNEGPSADDTQTRYSLQVTTRGGVRLTRRWGAVGLVLDPILLYRTAPNLRARGITTNAQGFRGSRETTRKKPPGTRRIVLIGGSAAFGWSASDDAHAPGALLEAELARRSRPVEVIQAGCPAYTATQEALYLSHELIEYEPDLVISLTGYNDLMATQPGWFGADVFSQIERRLEPAYGLGSTLANGTAIGRAISRRFEAPQSDAPAVLSASEAGARFRRGALTMSALVPDRLLVALQPCFLAHPRGTRPKAEEEWLAQFIVGDRARMEGLYASVRDEELAALREVEKRGARTVDLTAPFQNVDEMIFMDLCHLDDKGYELLARRLADEVLAHPAFAR